MNDISGNEKDNLKADTQQNLKDLSRSLLRLHKTLLEGVKAEYEAENGAIPNANVYLQLVLDDAHFAWLRKMSSLIALIDEAVSIRRPATETDAQALLNEAKILLNFGDADEDFNDKFHHALDRNADAVLVYNDALNLLK
jgi:predicted secreted acid phosphatase